MDFQLTDEQQAIHTMARDFAVKEMAPYANEWDQKAHLPTDVLKKAADLGFAGLYVRTDNGGCEMSRLDSVLVFEALSQACPSTAAFISIHNMASWMIDTYGNSFHHDKWLPDLMSMDKLASYCLTEAGSGSDAASLSTKAVKDGESYVLNGEKAFISGGGVSDVYVCMVRTGEPGHKGISAIVVEKDTPGLSFGEKEEKMGWNSQPTTTVVFDNCRVPAKNLLGNEGDGFKIAMHALDGGRLNIAACSLGGAQSCVDAALNYMGERKQFGKRLQDFQALQFKVADMATDLEASRLMVYRGAAALEAKDPNATRYCAMAKRYATDACFQICDEALQLHGGYGYIKEYGIERFLRDLRVHRILEGTNEIMRVIIARSILDR